MTLPIGVRGRLLASSLALIPLILIARFLLWPTIDSYLSAGDDMASTNDEIAHYRRLLAELPALQAAVSRFERTRPLSPYLLSGANRTLAAAGLQKQLQDAAEKLGVTILSLRVQNAGESSPLEHISVEARMRAEIDQLRDLLYWIETTRPYLFIDNLSIKTRHSGRRTRAPAGLEISLTLHGLRDKEQQILTGGSHG